MAGDGSLGEDKGGLVRRDVVTAFVRCEGRLLLLRRSERVGSYRGRWAAVSGYLEDSEPLSQALREIAEETGIPAERLQLTARAAPLRVPAPERGTLWVVHPFLFDLARPIPEIQLDWESSELRWAAPEEIGRLDTVPRLMETWQACADAEHG